MQYYFTGLTEAFSIYGVKCGVILIFAKQIPIVYNPNTFDGTSNAILSDSTGNFYVTGSFNGTGAFGPDKLVSETTYSQLAGDFFLARFSPEGECFGAVNFANAEGMSIGIDPGGNPIVVGAFKYEITIGDRNYFSHGDREIFIAKCGAISGLETKSTRNTKLLIYLSFSALMASLRLNKKFFTRKAQK